jgi:hypothetical protein
MTNDRTPGQGTPWGAMSPADFDQRLTARGHKREHEDQAGLFYVPAPTRAPRALAVTDVVSGQWPAAAREALWELPAPPGDLFQAAETVQELEAASSRSFWGAQ